MIHIKRFIEKVSLFEGRQNKDFVIPIQEARGVRDELAQILADYYQKNINSKPEQEPITIDIKGGSFK